eukprot:m51a1_g9220 putative serine threonine tyrosine-interacting protein (123) ;mRNA; r:61402-63073
MLNFPWDAHEIVPGLFLGSEDAASASLPTLAQRGITHVVVAGFGLRPAHPGRMQYLSLRLVDLPCQDLIRFLPQSVEFIRQGMRSGSVLDQLKLWQLMGCSLLGDTPAHQDYRAKRWSSALF